MGRRKGGRGGIRLRRAAAGGGGGGGPLCKEKGIETTTAGKKKGEERLSSKILVHTTRPQGAADSVAEFYTIDLVNDQVIPCPHALPGDFGFSSIAALGSLVYVIAGYNPGLFKLFKFGGLTEEEEEEEEEEVEEEEEKDEEEKINDSDHNLHSYAGSSCLDLNDDSGWKAAPLLKFNPTHNCLPICFSLCGKLFAFGLAFGEFFDPKCNDRWCQLLPPLDSAITSFNLSEPIVTDPSNNRFLARFEDTEALYAYYPDDYDVDSGGGCGRWQLLHPHFELWSSGMAYFDGVLYFYVPKLQDVIGAAFDVETKRWLNITFSSKFDFKDTKNKFDALLNLGNGTLCLVGHCPNFNGQFKTYVEVLKFRVGRTSTRNVIFTPVSFKRYTIPTRCKIVNYAVL